MSKVMDTSQWIAFFRKAGLPANAAANYALIFADNRIQVDMLLDLSKEYLYDMGIKLMGDVIAILKFAKEFHNQLAKERIIGIQSASSTKAVAERFVGHYTRSSPVHTPQAPILRRLSQPAATQRVAQPIAVRAPKRKPTVISLKKPPASPPFPKPRRVAPEEEGAYNIKMPQGTTERTRKILQLQQKKATTAQGLKRSVFSRLGDSSGSRLGDSSAVSSSTDTKASSSSVFERLGPSHKSDDSISSTVTGDFDIAKPKGPPLPYRGVLKMTVGKNRLVTTTVPKNANISSRTVIKPTGFRNQNVIKTVQINRINTVLRTNKSPKIAITTKIGRPVKSQGLFGKALSAEGVKSRLGAKVGDRNEARAKILLKNRLQLKSQSNVFDRLGK